MQVLEVRNLNKKIDNKEILKNISFSLNKGEIVFLAGLNGSGKSMLLKTIKGLEKESGGEILINGEKAKAKERMKKIALVFQDSSLELVRDSVKEDIAFGLENMRLEKEEIIRKVNETLRTFGLEKIKDENPRVLSGGEKRKVAIASVLAMGPDIILLDEPLSSLDYPSTVLTIKTIIELKEMNKAILLVSHEAEKLIKHTDRTIILKDGEIVADKRSNDALEDLRENNIYIPPLKFEEMTWLS